MTKKMKKAQFDFDDYLESIKQMKKLGGLGNIMNMLPGLGGMGGKMKGLDDEQTAEAERKMGRMEAIIHSMTPAEERIRISFLHPESTELPKVQGWTSAK